MNRLRKLIEDAYHNATCDDPAIQQEIDSWTAVQFAEDLQEKDGDIGDGGWTVEEIAAEVTMMREEKVIG